MKLLIKIDSRYSPYYDFLVAFFSDIKIILKKRKFTSYWQAILAYGNLKYLLVELFSNRI